MLFRSRVPLDITGEPRLACRVGARLEEDFFGIRQTVIRVVREHLPDLVRTFQKGNRETAQVAGSLLVIAAHPGDRALQAVFHSQLIDSHAPLRLRLLGSIGLLTSHDEATPVMLQQFRDIARWDPRQRAPFFAALNYENETEDERARANGNWRSPGPPTGPRIG